jgi:hypothetical protein
MLVSSPYAVFRAGDLTEPSPSAPRPQANANPHAGGERFSLLAWQGPASRSLRAPSSRSPVTRPPSPRSGSSRSRGNLRQRDSGLVQGELLIAPGQSSES